MFDTNRPDSQEFDHLESKLKELQPRPLNAESLERISRPFNLPAVSRRRRVLNTIGMVAAACLVVVMSNLFVQEPAHTPATREEPTLVEEIKEDIRNEGVIINASQKGAANLMHRQTVKKWTWIDPETGHSVEIVVPRDQYFLLQEAASK